MCIDDWARSEFGGADLGDARRTARLVRLGVSMAARPSGVITQVIDRPDEREAAFRFVENAHIAASAIAAASHASTARRCAMREEVVVAVDQATLALTDRVGKIGFGRTGPTVTPGAKTGLHVMNALAMRSDRTTEGLLAQQWWTRPAEKAPTWNEDRRPAHERESDLWCRTLREAENTLARAGGRTRAWYQLDRGADCAAVLELAADRKLQITVRSAYNRRLGDGQHHLHSSMQRRRARGRYSVSIPASTASRRRTATLVVRYAPVELTLRAKARSERRLVLWCVHVRERRVRPGAERLEWWLLTTVPVDSLERAITVVRNYTARWRVEEFHRAWKSGVCNIERSQLRSAAAFQRWATIAAAVASRAERLKTLSRTEPTAPGLRELSRHEIDAAILLTTYRCAYKRGQKLTIAQAVLLIANLGGYTGKSSGGPPGVRVIQRGLDRVVSAAGLLEALERSG
jgi:hypothetical protein